MTERSFPSPLSFLVATWLSVLSALSPVARADFDEDLATCLTVDDRLFSFYELKQLLKATCGKVIAANRLSGEKLAKVLSLHADALYPYAPGVFIAGDTASLQQALKEINQAIELDPTETGRYLTRAHIYDGLGMVGDANRAFNELMTPKSVVVSLFRDDFITQKIERYSRAISSNPNSAMTFNNRCIFRAEDGQFNAALDDCNRAIAMDGLQGTFFNSRGFVQFRMANYREAVSDFAKAISMDPNDADSLYLRGVSLLKLNDAKGNSDISRALSLDAHIDRQYRVFLEN